MHHLIYAKLLWNTIINDPLNVNPSSQFLLGEGVDVQRLINLLYREVLSGKSVNEVLICDRHQSTVIPVLSRHPRDPC